MKLPCLPVKCDDFHPQPDVKIFFLSHFHTDHMSGLSPSWNYGTIYCTPITRALLIEKYGFSSKLVHPIELSRKVSIPIGTIDAPFGLDVYLYDANHIPGSCMVLFFCFFGTLLYTGDFRYDPSIHHFADYVIDHVVLDETWLHLSDSTRFLTHQEVDEAFDCVVKHCAHSGPTDVVCYLHNHFGKEFCLQSLAEKLDAVVVLDDRRYRYLEIVASQNPSFINLARFTTFTKRSQWATLRYEDTSEVVLSTAPESVIEVVSTLDSVSQESLSELSEKTGKNHVAIVLTGWAVLGGAPSSRYTVFRLPYSLHNAPSEIINFVRNVRPMSVSPLTRGRRACTLMKKLGPFLRNPGNNDLPTVASVLKKGIPKELLRFCENPPVSSHPSNISSCTAKGGAKAARALGIKIRTTRSDSECSSSDAPHKSRRRHHSEVVRDLQLE